MTLGVVVFGHQTDLLTSSRWTLVGLVFSMILYFAHTYAAFFAGLVLATYNMSLWPLLAKRVANFPPHRVIPLAMLVTIFYMLLSAWVVAYNFVPGGIVTRERTDMMLIMLVLSCGLGSRNITPAKSAADVKGKSEAYRRQGLRRAELRRTQSKITLLGHVFRRLSTVTEEGEGEEFGSWDERGETETHKILSREVATAEDKEAQIFHGKILKGELNKRKLHQDYIHNCF